MRNRFAFLHSATLLAAALLSAGLRAGSGIAVAAKPYDVVPAFGRGVKFDQPVQVVFAPGDVDRAFVVERTGRVIAVTTSENPKREVFLDLASRLNLRANEGLLSFAFHPRYAENRLVYLWFSTRAKGARAGRLSRFQVSATNPSIVDLASETPLLTQATGPQGHDGGQLLFGPDGYLYLSLGDGDEHHSEPAASRQRIDRSFFGAVLRIDVDRKPESLAPNPHPAVHPGTYGVPPDNPFVGATTFNGAAVAPARVRTEFWAVGLRNPWRLDFDPATGLLWCGDVGLHEHEEVDIIERGGNYGWNFREGVGRGTRGRPPAGTRFIDPVWDYDHAQGLSVTGGFVYRGKNFPELEGKYLFGDYVNGKIWALTPDGNKPARPEQVEQIAKVPGIVAFARDPRNGDPLLVSYTADGVFRLVPKKK
ncbi:MAG TPA: PQQ-dependent sugar dehydrogenase [Opitutaceae bacterium]|nr:PQQ-dependent sugar dehydrogenase [Opitutaceae bacterium]